MVVWRNACTLTPHVPPRTYPFPPCPPPMKLRSYPTRLGGRSLACALLVAVVGAGTARAQLDLRDATTPPYDPTRLVEDVMLGSGVDVLGVTFDGDPEAVGYFEDAAASVGLERGVLLTTGKVLTTFADNGVDAAPGGPVASADATAAADTRNLDSLVGPDPGTGASRVNDAQRLAIRFRPRGDRIRLRYVFASEEYPEFVCSDFRDAFGLFLSGPGFSGPFVDGATNLALVPGTALPVTISSINSGSPGTDPTAGTCSGPGESLAFPSLYVDRAGATAPHAFDGQTVVLESEAAVDPCAEYVLSVEIGDFADRAFDSGLFVEAKSFSSNVREVDVAAPSSLGELAEGCAEAAFVFSLDAPRPADEVIPFAIIGTAQAGIDYDAFPPAVTIPAGQVSATVTLRALEDGLPEGAETVSLVVEVDQCSFDTATATIVDRRITPVPALADTTICLGGSAPLDATLAVAAQPDPTFTSAVLENDTNPGAGNFVLDPTVVYYSEIDVSGVVPAELTESAIVSVCVDLAHDKTSDVDLVLFAPNGRYVALASDVGAGLPGGFSQTCFSAAAPVSIADPAEAPPYDGTYAPIGDLGDLTRGASPVNGRWRLQITDDDAADGGLFASWSLTFASPYDVRYAWTPSVGLSCDDCPDPVAAPSAATTYTVTATDTYGCSESGSVTVDFYDPIAAPAITCQARFAELEYGWPVDPDAIRYEVSVDGGPRSDIGLVDSFLIDGLGFGVSRTLEVFAVTPCGENSATSTCTTQTCTAYDVTATATMTTCNGGTDGTVTTAVSGGTPPYVYTLATQSNTTGTFANLPAGTYTVDVVDANGCGGDDDATVDEPARVITAVAVAEPSVCGDPVVATASVASGAVGAVTYAWSDGQTGAQADFLASGTYYVDVEDANACRVTDSAVVVVPEPFAAAFPLTTISCAAADDGAATAIATGGYPPYDYELDASPLPSASVGGLAPGTHTLSAIDRIGCRVDTTFTLAEPLPLTAAPLSDEVSCHGGGDGRAYASVSGGTPPYTYSWDGGATTDVLDGVPAGSYDLTVRDGRGCQTSIAVVVAEPAPLAATVTGTDADCAGAATGRAEAVVTGGRRPYTFAWSSGTTTPDSVLRDLPAGTYLVDVTDAAGCETQASVTIGEPTPLAVGGVIQPITCAGEADGAITLSVSGATPTYTFLWSDGSTDRDRTGLSAGSYTVRVTDANGCLTERTFALDASAPLAVSATVRDLSCNGADDGAVLLRITGGGGDYTYAWSGPAGYAFFGASPTGLAPGTYRLDYRDRLGCARDTSFDVAEPLPLTVTTAVADTICFGAFDGRAVATASGGTAPYAFAWANGERLDTATTLTAGAQRVAVTDANGCTTSNVATVTELDPVVVSLRQTPVRCYGDSNGVALVGTVGYADRAADPAGFRYAWDGYPAAASTTLTGLGGGELAVVTATDARGCFGTSSVTVGEPEEVIARADVLADVSCHGRRDGVAVAEARGGIEPYTFVWRGAAGPGARTESLAAGSHTVVVADARGCGDSASVAIVEPDPLVGVTTMTQVNCFGPATGTIDAEVAGGTSPYTYLWEDGRANRYVDGLTAGTYVVEVTDSRGCELPLTTAVTTAAPVTVTGASFPVSCAGDRDGRIELAAAGGNAPYAFVLDDAPASGIGEFRYLSPGEYATVALDRDGCPSDTLALTVAEPAPIAVSIGEEISVELGDTAHVRSVVTGAAGGVEFAWLPADPALFSCLDCGDPVLTPTFEGVVRVAVVDANGCDAEDVLRIRLSKRLRVAVPTGFTPNDDGVDDRLLVHGKSGTEVLSFEVFDRWGERVWHDANFRVNDETRGWDGDFRGGRSPGGVYLWRAEVRYLDGVAESIGGQTTLIR